MSHELLIHEKNRVQKSHASVPLNPHKWAKNGNFISIQYEHKARYEHDARCDKQATSL